MSTCNAGKLKNQQNLGTFFFTDEWLQRAKVVPVNVVDFSPQTISIFHLARFLSSSLLLTFSPRYILPVWPAIITQKCVSCICTFWSISRAQGPEEDDFWLNFPIVVHGMLFNCLCDSERMTILHENRISWSPKQNSYHYLWLTDFIETRRPEYRKVCAHCFSSAQSKFNDTFHGLMVCFFCLTRIIPNRYRVVKEWKNLSRWDTLSVVIHIMTTWKTMPMP